MIISTFHKQESEGSLCTSCHMPFTQHKAVGKTIKFANLLKDCTGCEIIYPKTPDYTKKVDVGNFVVDNSKLRSLGWKPKVNLDEGIKKTLEYFKSQKIT